MNDISKFTDEELYMDLEDSQEDIIMCEYLLGRGTTEYGDHESVEDRLICNQEIEKIVIDELKRRGVWEKYNDTSR